MKRSALLRFLEKQTALQDQNVTAEDFLSKIVEVSELLVEREAGEYEFPHTSFHGFFAAEALSKMKEGSTIVLDHWIESKESPVWQETIPFFTAQLDERPFAAIIQSALSLGNDAVPMAAKCLNEYRTIDPTLAQEIMALGGQISGMRYIKLKQLLQAREWEKADCETDRVILEVKEKDSGEYLSIKNIKTFPCEDLLTIDRLWVEASNGHFGFSVQKKIWEKCGSPMSYNDDYKKFMEAVGWRSGNGFVSYSYLKFALALSPEGELPNLPNYTKMQATQVKSRRISTLFSRNDL